MDNRPIGIFDSGVGGLTVVSQVMKEMPEEQIIYFGDTARVPYGSKSKETVTKFSRQIIHFLLSKNVKAIIAACNTVSSNSMDLLQKEFDIPIFGVVEPGVREAIKATRNKKVGVIGTAATIRSGAYKKLIQHEDNSIEVYSKACPLFVPLVEEGWTETEVTRMTAENYLKELIEMGIDSIVLGCTHYPLLKPCLKQVLEEKVELVDPAHATALVVRDYLQQWDKAKEDQQRKEPLFYISDLTDTFPAICQKALNQTYYPVKIDIEQY